ncbi:MAG: FtsX-like permease family protein [Clostridiales bacterium]|nr:FtsX-like permease family protein [Clostridiales bacterium]
MKKKKNMLRKDFYMEIAKTMNRFISIFLIVAMGVAFFSGIRASEPDMRYTADDYFDERQLMDIRVLGTLGLTADDVAAIKELDGVADAVGGYFADVLCWSEDNQKVFKVMADMGERNRVDVIEGRMPEKAGECLIDAGTLENHSFKLGDKITFESGDDTDILDTLSTDTFEIVGIGSSPEYITFTRGSTTIGDGELDSFAIVTPDSFSMDVFSKIDVWVDGAADEVSYTDGYDDKVSEIVDRIEDSVAGARCEARYNEVQGEAKEEIDKAQKELDDARAEADEELGDALATLESSQKELEDGEKTLKEEEAKLADAKAQIAASEDKLALGQAEIAANEATLNSGWQEYNNGLAQYNAQAASVDFEAARQQLADGRTQLDAAKAKLEQQKNDAYATAFAAAEDTARAAAEEATKAQSDELDAAEAELTLLKTSLEQSAGQLESLQAQLAAVNEQIAALQSAGDSGAESSGEESANNAAQETETFNGAQVTVLSEVSASDDTLAELEKQRAALEAQIQELSATVSQLQTQYDASYETGMSKVTAGRAQIEAAINAAVEKVRTEDAKTAIRAEVDQQLNQNEAYVNIQQTISEQEEKLNDSEANLNALAAFKTKLDESYNQLVSGQAQLDAAKQELADGQAQLASAKTQLADGQKQIDEAKAELEEGRTELEDGWKEYEDGKAKAEEEIADGQEKLDDAKAEVEDIAYPKWYVSDRSALSGYGELGDNADRVRAIGEIFPVLFFLVAALISLTTMTRMVEEERIQIGTLKALGYGKGAIAKKYIYYALLATIGGSVVGVLFGEKVFPYIIVNAYKIVYPYIPNTTIPYNAYYGLLASVAAIVCITAAAFLACYKELMATPASLMRPVPPKQGRRILLERITPLWRHLSFTQKSTLRNLFRYKKRFFMTVFGIGGCMALMIVGFGLKDSIKDIVDLQYNKIQPYSGMVIMDEDAGSKDKDKLYEMLDGESGIGAYKTAYMLNTDIASQTKDWEAYIVVPESLDNLSEFMYFNDRTTGKEYQLDDSGIIISEKTAKLLDVGAGDTIQIKEDQFESRDVKIAAICENYVGHYIYMTPALYEETFGKPVEYNTVLIKIADPDMENDIGQNLLAQNAVVSVSYMDSIKTTLDDMLGSLDIIIVVLIISAGMLAFIVLYNLNNININERRRELASIKVLGFYDLEVAAYVYRENIYLTIIGMAFGCILGKILHQFIIVTVEIDSCMFGRIVYAPSYIYSMLLTVAFTILVNIAMFYKLRKIDMVESLKSVE